MKRPQNLQCYCCEELATTRDHIPPKCFFPDDYRSDLITVPSCSKHNNYRSKDDEYTAAVITMNSNSDLALTFFESKRIKTLLRGKGTLGKRIFSTARPARVISRKNGLFIPYETLAISYEVKRIETVIESMARALYYQESGYQEKWVNSCLVQTPKFLNKNLSYPVYFNKLNKFNQAFINLENNKELKLIKKGSHPEVFYYQFFKCEDGNFVIKMVFYGDFIFFAFLYSKTESPNPIILTV